MARIKHPLHSLRASGTFGKTITFAADSAHPYAKKKNASSTSATPAQLHVRQNYSAACAAWAALSPEGRATWNAQGDLAHLTAFNAFLRWYLTHTQAQWPIGQTFIDIPDQDGHAWVNAASADGKTIYLQYNHAAGNRTVIARPAAPLEEVNFPSPYTRIDVHDCTDDGQTCVGLATAPGISYPFIKRQNQPLFLLPDPTPPSAADFVRISGDGAVVTFMHNHETHNHTAIWTPTNGTTFLFRANSDPSDHPNGISNDGTIITGFAYQDSINQAFRHTAPATIEYLGAPPGTIYTEPTPCSDDGGVFAIGTALAGTNTPHTWHTGTGWASHPLPPTATDATPYAINNAGDALAGDAQGEGYSRAAIWNLPDTATLLDDCNDPEYSYAWTISADAKTIAGSITIEGVEHAAIWRLA